MSADAIEELARKSREETTGEIAPLSEELKVDTKAEGTVLNVQGDAALQHRYNFGDMVYYPVVNNDCTTVGKGNVIAISFLTNGAINYSISTDKGQVVVMPETLVQRNEEGIVNAYYANAFRCLVREMLQSGVAVDAIKDIIIQATDGAKL